MGPDVQFTAESPQLQFVDVGCAVLGSTVDTCTAPAGGFMGRSRSENGACEGQIVTPGTRAVKGWRGRRECNSQVTCLLN